MKCFHSIFIFIIILFLNIIFSSSKLFFSYPSSVTLENENILVFEKNGIYICDPKLEKIITTAFTFTKEDQIKDVDSLSNVIIKDKNDYIISLVNFKLFFFNRNNGDLLKTTDRLISDENPTYFTLAPIFKKNNYYYYVIGYFDGSVRLKLVYFKINLSSNYQNILILINTYDKIKGYLGWYSYSYKNRGLSCEYMLDDYTHEFNYLVCFLMIDYNGESLSQDFYEIDENSISAYHKYEVTDIQLNDVKLIKIITNNSIKRTFVLVFIENNNNFDIKIYSYYYEYKATNLNPLTTPSFKCDKKFSGIKTNYIHETNLINFSCTNSTVVNSILLNNNIEVVQTDKQFQSCTSIHGHSIIYSKYYEKYYIVSDVICDNHQRTFIPLTGDIPEYEEENEEEEEEKIKIEEEIEEEKNEKEEEKYYEEELFKETIEQFEIEEYIEKEFELEIFEEENYKGEIFEEKIEEKFEEKLEEKLEEIMEEKIKEEELILEEEIENKESYIEETDLNFECPLLKCSKCDAESLLKNLCIKCNNEKGYYLLNLKINNKYIECVNDTTKPSNFYFDNKSKIYEPCFETCAECNYKGNYDENNCTSCDDINYIKKPDYESSTNCVIKCKYLYYYTNYEQYKCTDNPFCPEDYNILIKDKYKCTNDCIKDNIYKYYYNGECLKECPNNTKDDNDFICKDSNLNNCVLSENYFMQLDENITDDDVEKLTKKYAKEFSYTESHISVYQNNIYTITIYKDLDCISDLSLEVPEINFGNCGLKVRNHYDINDNLIIAIIDKKTESLNKREMIYYGLYSPYSGNKLNSDGICEDDKIVVLENLSTKLKNSNIDMNTFSNLVSQGINVFNLSDPFYTDICFLYNSIQNNPINNKDIALKDRILVYFPNVTLCEDDCEIRGVNMTTYRAICECSYSKSKDILKDNALYQSQVGQFEELLSSSNIYVIKCLKNIFKVNYFKQCLGGIVILVILILEIICTIFYGLKGFNSIQFYILDITNKLINYSIQKEMPKRSIKNSKNRDKEKSPIKIIPCRNNDIIIDSNYTIHKNEKKEKYNQINKRNYKLNRLILRRHLLSTKNSKASENSKDNLESKFSNKNERKINVNDNNIITINNINSYTEPKNTKIIIEDYHKDTNNKISNEISISNNDSNTEKIKIIKDVHFSSISNLKKMAKYKSFFEDYLLTEFDNMDFEDLLNKDNRKFCAYYYEKIKQNQIIINIIQGEDNFKPKSIQFLFLLLQIVLYLLINALFYNEEYASEIFHLTEDSFSEILNRFIKNLVYSALVGVIINYIIEFFFIEESRMKKIFRKKKDNAQAIKYEINTLVRDIKIRYILFIIITFLITIFTWFHVSCFNMVYPHLKLEWLYFSIIIIIFMQLFSSFVCLIHSILRFFSFKCKSERLYKLSYLLS